MSMDFSHEEFQSKNFSKNLVKENYIFAGFM